MSAVTDTSSVIVEFQWKHERLRRLRDLERVIIPTAHADLERLQREAMQLRWALGMPRGEKP